MILFTKIFLYYFFFCKQSEIYWGHLESNTRFEITIQMHLKKFSLFVISVYILNLVCILSYF